MNIAQSSRTLLPQSVLVLSSYDYRTDRDVALFSIARALAKRAATVSFVSLLQADKAEVTAPTGWIFVEGVRCLACSIQQRSTRSAMALKRLLSASAVDSWTETLSPDLNHAIGTADVVIVRGAAAAGLVPRVRRFAPLAQLIDFAAAPLRAGSLSPSQKRLCDKVDRYVLAGSGAVHLTDAADAKIRRVPYGIDLMAFDVIHPSPFERGRLNIVSIGSKPLDASVVQVAALSFPEAAFHLFGAPDGHRYPSNVLAHDMPPERELAAYLQHADLGLAAYAEGGNPDPMDDLGLDLARFDHVGLPVVCPDFLADGPAKAAYVPGRSLSIRDAFRFAFTMPRGKHRVIAPEWDDVACRIVGSGQFATAEVSIPHPENAYAG